MNHQRRVLLFICIALLCCALPAFADGLKATFPKSVTPYKDAELVVDCPCGGTLDVLVTDEAGQQAHPFDALTVSSGRQTLLYNGTAQNDEPLRAGTYTLNAVFTPSDGGGAQNFKQAFTVKTPAGALQYALPICDTLYQGQGIRWYIEVKAAAKGGRCYAAFYTDASPDKPVYTMYELINSENPFNLNWDGRFGKKAAPDGQYTVKVYTSKMPDIAVTFKLTVTSEKAPAPALAKTEDALFLPADGASDDAVWQAMMTPLWVLDIKDVDHQQVYAKPDKGSAKLGRLHGQSQAVKVIDETPVNGYVKIGAWQHENGEYVEGYVPASSLKIVYPSKRYGLLIDKKTQTLTVYENGAALGSMPITTGKMALGKAYQETPAGAFFTVSHIASFREDGIRYEYPIRYDGGNLLHQVGYVYRNGKKADFSAQNNELGTKASHACVRVPARSDCGINMYWLWTHIPFGTKVLILDDADTRRNEYWQLYPTPSPVPTLAPAATPAPPKEAEKEIVITAAGDCVLGGRETYFKRADSIFPLIEQHGYGYPFSKLRELFSQDDLTFVNLECVLKNDSAGIDADKLIKFRAPTDYVEMLKQAGIESVNIANNHYIDYTARGKQSTRDTLDAAGIPYSGYGYYYVFEKSGVKIGFAGIRETTYKQKNEQMETDIKTLQGMGCDVIIYTCHFGNEYEANHNALQEKMAHRAVELGANIVIGHHPHVVQGIEHYQGGLILYSLGNCMFAGTLDLSVRDGLIARLALRFDEQNRYLGTVLTLLPIRITGSDDSNDFCPYVSSGQDMDTTFWKIQNDTPFELHRQMFFGAQ